MHLLADFIHLLDIAKGEAKLQIRARLARLIRAFSLGLRPKYGKPCPTYALCRVCR
jgi:hypothetical protein